MSTRIDPYHLMERLRADLPGNNWRLTYFDHHLGLSNDRVLAGDIPEKTIPLDQEETLVFLRDCYPMADPSIKDALGTWHAMEQAKEEKEKARKEAVRDRRLRREEERKQRRAKIHQAWIEERQDEKRRTTLLRLDRTYGENRNKPQKKTVDQFSPRYIFPTKGGRYEQSEIGGFSNPCFPFGVSDEERCHLAEEGATQFERVQCTVERLEREYITGHGPFLGDSFELAFTDRHNGWSFFKHDRSGHSGRV